MPGYQTLEISEEFMRSLLGGRFSRSEQDQLFKALQLLDENERHPSLRVHRLTGPLAGQWVAYASTGRAALRVTFKRLSGGRKEILDASRHYGD